MRTVRQTRKPQRRLKKKNNLAGEQEEAEKRKAKEERIAKEKEEYYWEHFDELMVQKIDSGEKLSENELRSLVFENGEESEWGENRRWPRRVATIVKLCGRYFAINWEEGADRVSGKRIL